MLSIGGTHPLPTPDESSVTLRVVIKRRHSSFNLHHIPFENTATGEDVVQKLRQLYDEHRPLYRSLVEQTVMGSRPAVYSVTISRVRM